MPPGTRFDLDQLDRGLVPGPEPNRTFASSNARIVASTSYGSSSNVRGSHSLRGVAKKSPP